MTPRANNHSRGQGHRQATVRVKSKTVAVSKSPVYTQSKAQKTQEQADAA